MTPTDKLVRWEKWLEKELAEDGRESRVFGPDRLLGRHVYAFTIKNFLALTRELIAVRTAQEARNRDK